MNISPEALRFDADRMWIDLSDGRVIGVPLTWFPRLLHASPEERDVFELSRRGMHWPSLDEDISVAGLVEGKGDRTRTRRFSGAGLTGAETEDAVDPHEADGALSAMP